MYRWTTILLLSAGCQEWRINPELGDLPEPPDTDQGVSVFLPDITVEPATLDFGAHALACVSTPQQITIRNDGTGPLTLDDVAFVGAGASAFSWDGELRRLQPGEALTVDVVFSPDDYVDYAVDVVVSSDDPADPESFVGLSGEGAEDATIEELFLQEEATAVDVLWVVDNSGSMSTEIGELARSFQTFINAIVDLELDFQIGVITTDMDDPAHQGRIVGPLITVDTVNPVAAFTSLTSLGTDGSGSERGFDAAHAALTPPLAQGDNAGFLRTDANLAVVVVSDEDDDSSLRAAAFGNWLETLKPNAGMTSFSGLVGPDGGSTAFPVPACDLFGGASADHAPWYHDAITATGGVWGDICRFDIHPFLQFLSYVAAGLQFQFDLAYTPSVVSEIEVLIDGLAAPYGLQDGWTYDPGRNRVELHGNAVPAPGASVQIRYPYQTTCE
jgi:hypothetical protein